MNDIRRIAFVTGHYFELRGLMPAAFGGALIVGALMMQAVHPPDYRYDPFPGLMLAMLTSSFVQTRLDAMYRRTFGDVVATTWQKMVGGLPVLLVMGGAVVDQFPLDHPRGPHASLAAIALAVYSVAVVVGQWRWRAHYAVTLVAALGAAVVTASAPASVDWWRPDPARNASCLAAYILIGLGVLVAGLFDHYLLSSSLQRAGGADDGPRLRGTMRPSIARVWAAGIFCLASGICIWGFAPPLLSLALPTALMGAVVLSITVFSIRDARGGFRRPSNSLFDGPRHDVTDPTIPAVDLGADLLVFLGLIGLSAAVDAFVMSSSAPVLFPASIGVTCAWLAIRNRPARGRFLLGTAAAAAALASGWFVPPARAFAILVFTMSCAVLLDGVLELLNASARDRSHGNAV